jgi:uncharacterized protein (TIGR03083 family)
MTQTFRPVDRIPSIDHAEAMRLTATENNRLLTQLRCLTDDQWQAPTDCARWSVRDIVVHLIASAQSQASPVEFVRQVRAGRPLTAEIGGDHWVDGVNEAQLRARTGWDRSSLPGRWEQHSAAALTARRRMPGAVRALPLLPLGTAMGVRMGWKPIGYLAGIGFTRDVWMHRMDIARAAGIQPELTAEHDGRIVADIVAEWAGLHGEPFALVLTGPAGGAFQTVDGDPETVDAVDFARILSGRAEGSGVLRHKLPL